MQTKILIIDDDMKLVELLQDYLANNNYQTSFRNNGLQILDYYKKLQPNLIILDHMMPEKDGLEVLRELRSATSVPIIMLTAKGEETDRIVGLELGADDYLPKPFNPRELLARIRAVLRRQGMDTQQSSVPPCITIADITLNTANYTVEVDGKIKELSTTEFKILEVLMRHPNQVLSRDQIMQIARGRDFEAFDRSIDIHISKLRSKIENDPTHPKRIKTIWGTGYMFTKYS